MVATWLTELYLDQINRALLDSHSGDGEDDGSSVEKLEQQLQVRLQYEGRPKAGSIRRTLTACMLSRRLVWEWLSSK